MDRSFGSLVGARSDLNTSEHQGILGNHSIFFFVMLFADSRCSKESSKQHWTRVYHAQGTSCSSALVQNIMKRVGNDTDEENPSSLRCNAGIPCSNRSTHAELSIDCTLQGILSAGHDFCKMKILEISDGDFSPAREGKSDMGAFSLGTTSLAQHS